jgi:hypothetical protein
MEEEEEWSIPTLRRKPDSGNNQQFPEIRRDSGVGKSFDGLPSEHRNSGNSLPQATMKRKLSISISQNQLPSPQQSHSSQSNHLPGVGPSPKPHNGQGLGLSNPMGLGLSNPMTAPSSSSSSLSLPNLPSSRRK